MCFNDIDYLYHIWCLNESPWTLFYGIWISIYLDNQSLSLLNVLILTQTHGNAHSIQHYGIKNCSDWSVIFFNKVPATIKSIPLMKLVLNTNNKFPWRTIQTLIYINNIILFRNIHVYWIVRNTLCQQNKTSLLSRMHEKH